MLYGFRDSAKHVEDIDHVIRYMQKKHGVPVWLVGTSRGTESAAHVAINSKQTPHGLILTSSMSMPNSKGTELTEMALERITIPTLIVAHTRDECWVTPPLEAEDIAFPAGKKNDAGNRYVRFNKEKALLNTGSSIQRDQFICIGYQ